MKRSRQREAILEILCATTSHPTADWIYDKVRERIPNISLGTVYRNLNILSENGEIYLTHTEVLPALEGKGIASQLVLKVLQDIEHKNLKLVPLCPFVAGYIQKHPEWKKLIMRGVRVE